MPTPYPDMENHGSMVVKGQTFQTLVQAIVEVSRELWDTQHIVPQMTMANDECTIAIYSLADPEGARFDTWLARLNSASLLAILGIECPPDSLQTTVQ